MNDFEVMKTICERRDECSGCPFKDLCFIVDLESLNWTNPSELTEPLKRARKMLREENND